MSSTVLTLPSWKEEPLSPPHEGPAWAFSPDDILLYSTLTQNDDFKFEPELLELSDCDSKGDIAVKLLEQLENLVDLDELIKEEPYFVDVKMLPILDEHVPSPLYPIKVESYKTETLFGPDSVCGMIDFGSPSIASALTPPQSPPVLTTLKPLEPLSFDDADQSINYTSAVTPQPDIARELAVVDELVRSRVETMQWSVSPASPCSNSSSSSSGGTYDDTASSFNSDLDWTPELDVEVSSVKTSKRSKPYARTAEDKKSRKKEQNKNAATRYRMKKKAEVEIILSEEKQLMQEGESLNNQITEIQREIKYLKGLMRDLFKAKGLVN